MPIAAPLLTMQVPSPLEQTGPFNEIELAYVTFRASRDMYRLKRTIGWARKIPEAVMVTDESIDGMIRQRAAVTPPPAGALDGLLRVSVERASRRTSRRWLLAPATVMAVLLGGLGLTGSLPALADTIQRFATETGIFGDGLGPGGSDSEKHYTEQDGSEWVNIDSPDFVAYAVRLMPSYITLPAGTDRTRFATNAMHLLHDGLPAGREAVMQVTGVRRAFEGGAQCLWYHDWKDAAKAGDTAEAAIAGRQYLTAATWPLTVATDGGGVVAGKRQVHRLAAAGRWNDADAVLGTTCDSAYMRQLTR